MFSIDWFTSVLSFINVASIIKKLPRGGWMSPPPPPQCYGAPKRPSRNRVKNGYFRFWTRKVKCHFLESYLCKTTKVGLYTLFYSFLFISIALINLYFWKNPKCVANGWIWTVQLICFCSQNICGYYYVLLYFKLSNFFFLFWHQLGVCCFVLFSSYDKLLVTVEHRT